MQTSIQNSSGETISVLVEGLKNLGKRRLAFVMHGFTGYKEHYLVRIPVKSFISKGYVVVSFDARHSFGDSFGALKDGSITTFIDDLETVIAWAKKQEFYTEPFAICGHSLGGGAALKVAESRPQSVNKLILLSSLFSGELLWNAYRKYNAELLENWKKEPIYRERKDDVTKNGYMTIDYMNETNKYDFVQGADKITASVLLVTGDGDKSSPPESNEIFLNALKTNKELCVVKGCGHFFSKPENKNDLKNAIEKFLDKKIESF